MVAVLQKLKSDFPDDWIERLDLSIAAPSIDVPDFEDSSTEPGTPKRSRSSNLEARLADDDQRRELRLYSHIYHFYFNSNNQ